MNIKDLEYKRMPFTLYNMIEEDSFIMECERDDKEKYSIDDFEWSYVKLTEKEKFLVRMHNSEILDNVDRLIGEISKVEKRFKIYTRFDTGNLILIKLKKAELPRIEINLPKKKAEKKDGTEETKKK